MITDWSPGLSQAQNSRAEHRHRLGSNRLVLAALPRAGLAVFWVTLAVLLFALAGLAAAAPAARFVTPGEARTGTLLLKGEQPGRYVEAPRVGSDFDVSVSGPTARGRLTQHFFNPTDGFVEAVYVFPLPEDAAVDQLKMVIGKRVVIGEIKERSEAKTIYETAKRAGKKAVLLEQERANIFTHSVANIGPGETVVVQLEWQQAVAFNDRAFQLRLPLVVGPRYNPKPIVQTVELGGEGGWGSLLDPVPDRDRISPPVLDPREHGPVNPVTVTVRLNAGFEIGEVKSYHHEIDVDEAYGQVHGRIVRLKAGSAPADKDFELTWAPNSGDVPSVGLFRESVDGEDYVLAFVVPPVGQDAADGKPGSDEAAETPIAREIVFVVDDSGSMGGLSIRQARAGLIFGLDRLKPSDTFNIIRFNNAFSQLFPRTVPASPGNVRKAKAFVGALSADGGTEMTGPMAAALRDLTGATQSASSQVRQVVFLTDGAIGNERQLLELIGAKLGRSRLFMVGIGSAPNSYLMTRAAEIGRGTFTHIGSADQVATRMRETFEKLENPVVTNLTARFGTASADALPGLIPDVYRGEPVVVAAKVGRLEGDLTVEGSIGEQPWRASMPLTSAATATGISKVWARRKIRDAEVAMRLGRIQREDGDTRILELALAHSLVSRLTSLVAVESDISRPEGEALSRADVPLNLPAGWDFEKVFGTGAERGQERDQRADAAIPRSEESAAAPQESRDGVAMPAAAARVQKAQFASVAAAAKPRNQAQILAVQQHGQHLPQTATDAELRIAFGLTLLVLAWLAACRRRARRIELR